MTGSNSPFEMVISILGERVKKRSLTKVQALCPAHADRKPSLSVSMGNDGRVLLHCHSGCTHSKICEALKIREQDLFHLNRPSHRKRDQREIVATFDYFDESGEVLYQTVRYHPKDFRQRQPDGKGGWVWNLKDVNRVLYRLPDLIKGEKSARLYICEGEKDVETLRSLGLIATCCPMGAGKWRPAFNQYFVDRDVVICSDNDEPGQKHVQKIAKNLFGKACSIKIIEFTELGEKEDVSDWVQVLKHTSASDSEIRESLEKLATDTPEWQPESTLGNKSNGLETTKAADSSLTHERPSIVTNDRQLDDVTMDAWEALDRLNTPPKMFRFGGRPARLEMSDIGETIPFVMRKDEMREKMSHSADWIRENFAGRINDIFW